MRIAGAQLCLSDSGTGAGATKAVVKVNGTAVTAANDLSIAGAAGNKTVSVAVTKGSNQYPGGARLNAGDIVTIDITAVPATTVPALAFVVLDIVEVDI
jgi:protein involved in polysaccharide export with SLBB domain